MNKVKGLSLLLTLGMALAQTAHAQLADVTQPGDAITATSANSPGSEGVTNAIDGQPTKYLNFDISDTGFTVTPSVGLTVVNGLSLQSANDAPDRDPTTYLLEGSYDGTNFTEISSGDVADFPDRFHTNYIFFDNSVPYVHYRLIFPTVDNSTCCMQIAEVELLGAQAAGDVTQPGDALVATSANSPGSEGVTNAIDNAPTKYLNFDISETGFTVTPSVGMTIVNGLSLQSANDAPDRDPTTYLLQGSYDGTNFADISSGDVADFPDRFHTNYIFFDNSTPYLTYRLIFPTVDNSTCCMQIAEVEFLGSQAPGDVTQPGDDIVATSANSPGSEGVTNAIDGQPTKYLNFDITDTGFTVTPSVGLTIVNGLSLQSANDAPDRDPTTYRLEGSYDGTNFTEISSGDVADFPERFHTNYIYFDNDTAYLTYRLIFPTVDNSTCCMQIAEVELLGVQLPGDVTQPGDAITATSANSPGSEGVTNAIDNAPTKYLNFDISDTGFTVTPAVGLTEIIGLSLQSANDAPDRDPTTYLLEGSYDGTNFTEISSGSVADFPDRFHTNYIFFDNTTPYLTYRLIFPTVDNSTCCMQIAEVELFPRPGGSCSDLTLVDAGLIRLQPNDTPVLEGSTAEITVVPTGPWNVQWESKAPGEEEFSAVAGATSDTISIANVGSAQDGTLYRAVVSTPGCEGQISNEVALNLFTPSDTRSIGYTWIGGGANGAPTSMNPDDIAGFHPQAYWNNLNGGSGDDVSNAVDLAGEPTTVVDSNNDEVGDVGFDFTTDGTWGVGTGDGNPTQRMLNGLVRTDTKNLDEGDTPVEITFFGVPAGSHTVILYAVQVPLEFFDMNVEVEGANGVQRRFTRPQNSDEYNPSPGFVLMAGETEETRSVGNMMIFSGVEPSNGEILVRYWAPNGDIQGPGINAMQIVLDPPPAPPVPVITQNPQSTNGVLGAGLELTVAVDGQDTSIQWFKDGQPIGGATGTTYGVASLSEGDAGVYTVAVTNPAGRILSRAAVVNVLEENNLQSGLVAYFPFDGNGDNVQGGPAAEVVSGGFGDGQIGQALELNGFGDYALAPSYEKPIEAITVSAWVNSTSPDFGPIVRNWASNAGEGRFGQLILDVNFPIDAVAPQARGIVGVGPNEPAATGFVEGIGEGWHHLAMTANGSTTTLYLDGEVFAVNDYLGNLNDSDVNWLSFGAELNLAADLDGNIDFGGDPELDESAFSWGGGIDDVAIFNRSLSGPEIQSVFEAGSAGNPITEAASVLNTEMGTDTVVPVAPQLELTDGLVALWNFDDGSFNDSIGEFHGEANGSAPIQFTKGQDNFGQAIRLDGADQFVEIVGGEADDLAFAGGSMALSAWFKVDTFDKNWQAIIAKGEGTNWRVHRRSGEGGLGHAGGIGEGPAGADVSLGEWHHLVAVTDAEGAEFGTRLYVDGEVYTENTGAAVLAANGMRVMLGENPDARGRYFAGELDDVALWNRVLTPDEVQTLFTGDPLGGPSDAEPPAPAGGISSISIDGATVTIEFTGSLQSADTVDGPYSAVDGASSPFTVDAASGNKFYIAQ